MFFSKTGVVYNISCQDCSSSYVSHTSRSLQQRIRKTQKSNTTTEYIHMLGIRATRSAGKNPPSQPTTHTLYKDASWNLGTSIIIRIPPIESRVPSLKFTSRSKTKCTSHTQPTRHVHPFLVRRYELHQLMGCLPTTISSLTRQVVLHICTCSRDNKQYTKYTQYTLTLL